MNLNGHKKNVTPPPSEPAVRADVEAATVLEPYPADRYQAVREGRMSTEAFIDDLIRHVRAGIERTAHGT